MKIKECMCNKVNTVKPDTTVTECAKIMCDKHVGCLPVCDCNNQVVGILTDRDILLRTVACQKDTSNTSVNDIMTKNVHCCDCNEDIKNAQDLMIKEQIRRIPIIENNKIVGILTLGDLATNENIFQEDLCNTIEGICNCNKKNAN